MTVTQLETKLDSLNTSQRYATFEELLRRWRMGEITMPAEGTSVNVHLHTFHSYNAYGYSPLKVAWLARRHGLAIAGIVDFDVFFGMDEFLFAARALGLRACVGMETRVFIPEFAPYVITSPGEPGISYHMGIGFPFANLPDRLEAYRRKLQTISQDRNRRLVEKVNAFLSPVALDYGKDAAGLTPSSNVTERHLSDAYVRKAEKVLKDKPAIEAFWRAKLSIGDGKFDPADGNGLKNLIRSKLMKKGGAGYIPPDTRSFPRMEEFNHFVADAGGIPALTWVDGISDGEQRMEELCRLAMKTQVAAINAIPDPRYTPHKGAEREKLKNLYALVDLAKKLNLLIISGTEMNIFGQHFVDDFSQPELAPLLPYLAKSAYVFYSHSVLQRECGLGYLSPWAKKHFPDLGVRNDFYHRAGELLRPAQEERLRQTTDRVSPEEIMKVIRRI